MQCQGIESPIDPVAERDAIVEFLNQYWDVRVEGTTLPELVDLVLEKGFEKQSKQRD